MHIIAKTKKGDRTLFISKKNCSGPFLHVFLAQNSWYLRKRPRNTRIVILVLKKNLITNQNFSIGIAFQYFFLWFKFWILSTPWIQIYGVVNFTEGRTGGTTYNNLTDLASPGRDLKLQKKNQLKFDRKLNWIAFFFFVKYIIFAILINVASIV